jgi:hypothetical protein
LVYPGQATQPAGIMVGDGFSRGCLKAQAGFGQFNVSLFSAFFNV